MPDSVLARVLGTFPVLLEDFPYDNETVTLNGMT